MQTQTKVITINLPMPAALYRVARWALIRAIPAAELVLRANIRLVAALRRLRDCCR